MVVVKADAYGHGAVRSRRRCAAEGCGHFGVATISRGARVARRRHSRRAIYLLGGFFAEQAREILALDVTPFDLRSLACSRRSNAAARNSAGPACAVHLKIDTGATRLGILPAELARRARAAARRHRAEARRRMHAVRERRRSRQPVTDQQLRVFVDALATLRTAGMRPAGACMRTTRPRWCCAPTRISIWCARASRFMDCRRCSRCARKSICIPS